MKKLLLIIIALVLTFSLVACDELSWDEMSDLQKDIYCDKGDNYIQARCTIHENLEKEYYTKEQIDEMLQENRDLQYIREFNTWCTSTIASGRNDSIHNCITFIEALDKFIDDDFDWEEDYALLTENQYTDLLTQIELNEIYSLEALARVDNIKKEVIRLASETGVEVIYVEIPCEDCETTLIANAQHQDYVDWFEEYEELLDDFIGELYRQAFYFDDLLEDYEQNLSSKLSNGESLTPEEVEFLLDYQERLIEWREFERWVDEELFEKYNDLMNRFPEDPEEEVND